MRLSQPAVTGQVKTLEQRIGRPLFVRQARGVVATPLAEMLAAEAAPHVDALARLVGGGLREQDPVAERTVHIGGPAELMTLRVVPSFAPLVTRGLRIRSVLGLPEDLLAALSTGRRPRCFDRPGAPPRPVRSTVVRRGTAARRQSGACRRAAGNDGQPPGAGR